MFRYAKLGLSLLSLLLSLIFVQAQAAPTLADFWEERAVWELDRFDVGLPVGESDTVLLDDGRLWSYLHASSASAGLLDQCGQPVPFPGCLTRWESVDGGVSFSLPVPMCLIPCEKCPCDDARDQISAQQYPRVVSDGARWFMAYEWHAQTILRASVDGLRWPAWNFLRTPGGTWPLSFSLCDDLERIGNHPHIRGQADGCLVGAPPGLYLDDDTLYVFVAAGSAPGNMRCYRGSASGPLDQLQRCTTDPLFSGASEYGPLELRGAAANAYFDFRYVSSADLLRVEDRYYMFYEGIRGPDALERGMDTQFALGLARSLTDQIDGPWEKFPGNPILRDISFNWGIGHADVLLLDGVTYLYTATSQQTRGRYVLRWASDVP